MANSNFEIDVYISYSHGDNAALLPNEPEWVTRFHETLSAMLAMRLGREAVIWRDSKLSGNDIFDDSVISQFPKTAVFLTVMSPRYVNSEWCLREVTEFCHAAEQTGGIVVDGKARILKVIKLPVANENNLPDVLNQTLGYPFFIIDENEKEAPIELDPAYGEEFKQKYLGRIAKLAYDIADLVQKMRPLSPAVAAPVVTTAADRPSVFAAGTSADRIEYRKAVVPSPEQVTAATQSSTEERTADNLAPPSVPVLAPSADQMTAATQILNEPRKKEKDIFISYARKDEGFVLELAKKMSDLGISVWIDQWDIEEGDDWDIAIDNALYGLPAFLIVISPTAADSKEVRNEMRAALLAKKHIFPVKYLDCPRPPRDLLNLQWTDLTAKGLADEAAIQHLVARIRSKLSQKVQ